MGSDLKEIAALIETGAQAKEVRRIVRAIRLTMMLRRKLKAPVVYAFLGHVLTAGSEAFAKLSSFLPKVMNCIMGLYFVSAVRLVFYSDT